MANCCLSDLKITGSKESMNKMYEFFGSDIEHDYDWSVWNIDFYKLIEKDEDLLNIYYSTPGTPNINFIEYLGRHFSNLDLSLVYIDPCELFAGQFTIINGLNKLVDHPITPVCFGYDIENNSYKFFEDEDEIDEDEIEKINLEDVLIIGSYWQRALWESNIEIE